MSKTRKCSFSLHQAEANITVQMSNYKIRNFKRYCASLIISHRFENHTMKTLAGHTKTYRFTEHVLH